MDDLSRRTFLGAASTALGYSRIIGANDRLRVGVIGCGGKATGHMRIITQMKQTDNCEVVAVSDLYTKRMENAAGFTGAKQYRDYKQLLAVKDIDWVLIGTPEHWHCQNVLDTVDADKHIYCEKPMTRTVEQSKKVVAKVKASKVKMQVGVQGLSDDSYEAAHKLIKDGYIGRPVLAQIDYSRNHAGDFWVYKQDEGAKPGPDLDWDKFQGYNKKRPWDPDRFFSWRRYWDYSGGIAADLLVHRVTRLIRALGLTFPEYVCATGGKYQFRDSKADIPDTMNVLLDYPEGLTVQLISSQANETPVPHLIRGHKATLEFTRKGFTITPQKQYANEVKPYEHIKTGGEDVMLHTRNLQNAIRNNEPLRCDIMTGYYGVVASEMGVMSLRKRKYVKWDKTKERIVLA